MRLIIFIALAALAASLSLPANSGFIRGSGGGAPATDVEITGTGQTVQDGSSGSASITIPSDADVILISWAGFTDGAAPFSVLSLDGAGLDFGAPVATASWTGYGITTAAYVMDSDDFPGTGSQTLTYTYASATTEGAQFRITYLTNVDTTTPVGDTDSSAEVTTWTSALTGVAAEDMGVIACYGYVNTPDVNPSGAGQTVDVESAAFNFSALSVGYELGEDALEADITVSSDEREVCVALGFNNG